MKAMPKVRSARSRTSEKPSRTQVQEIGQRLLKQPSRLSPAVRTSSARWATRTYIESPYAYNSITDFCDNIVSCKNALYGQKGATAPNDKSLIYFCLNSGNSTLVNQANAVVSKLDVALAKIKAMKAPFALYYSDASCKIAIDALGELDDALGALSETLNGYAGNETVEAQCKVINENYVDNVVLATYRALADNAQTLYQSIVKIKN